MGPHLWTKEMLLELKTDASTAGWDAVLNRLLARAFFPLALRVGHINPKELMTGWLVVESVQATMCLGGRIHVGCDNLVILRILVNLAHAAPLIRRSCAAWWLC